MLATETLFNSTFGGFNLRRLPLRKRDLLRAWDAADEYLLDTLKADSIPINNPIICNDSFGALSVALNDFSPVNWSDSCVAHEAAKQNTLANKLSVDKLTCLTSLEQPQPGIDLVLIKVPKTLALLEDQLLKLKPLLKENSRLIVAGMAKSMPSSIWKLLETIIGTTETSLAKKKARLIFVKPDMQLVLPKNPYPVTWLLETTEYNLLNHANVFSREKLDVGTRFLLQQLPQTDGPGDILDLGCGNGVLGLMAGSQNDQAQLYFVDESYMAVESAMKNYKQLNHPVTANYYSAYDLSGFESGCMDLILCNPPFHQHQAVGDAIALSMFTESKRVLREGGELWVVGNSHLAYHKKLHQWFKTVTKVASNRKFVISKAVK